MAPRRVAGLVDLSCVLRPSAFPVIRLEAAPPLVAGRPSVLTRLAAVVTAIASVASVGTSVARPATASAAPLPRGLVAEETAEVPSVTIA